MRTARSALPEVLEHVHQHVPNLSWRTKHAVVVAILEHASPQLKGTVHGARNAHTHGHHPPPERGRASRLHQEVHVVALERELHDAKRSPFRRLRERPPHFAHEPPVAQ